MLNDSAIGLSLLEAPAKITAPCPRLVIALNAPFASDYQQFTRPAGRRWHPKETGLCAGAAQENPARRCQFRKHSSSPGRPIPPAILAMDGTPSRHKPVREARWDARSVR